MIAIVLVKTSNSSVHITFPFKLPFYFVSTPQGPATSAVRNAVANTSVLLTVGTTMAPTVTTAMTSDITNVLMFDIFADLHISANFNTRKH